MHSAFVMFIFVDCLQKFYLILFWVNALESTWSWHQCLVHDQTFWCLTKRRKRRSFPQSLNKVLLTVRTALMWMASFVYVYRLVSNMRKFVIKSTCFSFPVLPKKWLRITSPAGYSFCTICSGLLSVWQAVAPAIPYKYYCIFYLGVFQSELFKLGYSRKNICIWKLWATENLIIYVSFSQNLEIWLLGRECIMNY